MVWGGVLGWCGVGCLGGVRWGARVVWCGVLGWFGVRY